MTFGVEGIDSGAKPNLLSTQLLIPQTPKRKIKKGYTNEARSSQSEILM
jgi:hypothetical protein